MQSWLLQGMGESYWSAVLPGVDGAIHTWAWKREVARNKVSARIREMKSTHTEGLKYFLSLPGPDSFRAGGSKW